MKLLLFSLAVLIAIPCRAAVSVRAGTNISNYPNISSPSTNARYVLELPGVTNYNISHQQLRTLMTNGMATSGLVTASTNGLAHTNFVKSQDTIVSNGVISQLLILSNNMPANLWTNSGGFVRLTTNGPVSISSTGLLGGLVVTQDVRFLGHNSASNSVWVCTNATTGEGEWRTFTGAGIAALNDLLWTNSSGTLRPKLTNVNFIGGGSNNNIASPAGFNVIGGGSENDIQANYTWGTIAGGFDNIIHSNTALATICGGQQNTAGSNSVFIGGGSGNIARGIFSVVTGGDNNQTVHDYGVVVGGRLHAVRGQFSAIVSGSNNNIYAGTSGDGRNVIGGGSQNSIGAAATFPAAYAVIGGGSQNTVQNDCDFGFVGGGRENNIQGASSTNGVIAGGAFNNIAGAVKFASILGGERNTINNRYGYAVGTSNTVNADRAGAIGMNVTNSTAGSVTVGELISYNTPSVIAGAGNGSTNYLLSVTSPKMLMGSSNVNIYGVSGTIAGKTHTWSANITNLSGDTWGISFDSGTNRWKFQSWMYGTNAPSVLTNNTLLRLNGESEGTNTLVTYEYFSPAL